MLYYSWNLKRLLSCVIFGWFCYALFDYTSMGSPPLPSSFSQCKMTFSVSNKPDFEHCALSKHVSNISVFVKPTVFISELCNSIYFHLFMILLSM